MSVSYIIWHYFSYVYVGQTSSNHACSSFITAPLYRVRLHNFIFPRCRETPPHIDNAHTDFRPPPHDTLPPLSRALLLSPLLLGYSFPARAPRHTPAPPPLSTDLKAHLDYSSLFRKHRITPLSPYIKLVWRNSPMHSVLFQCMLFRLWPLLHNRLVGPQHTVSIRPRRGSSHSSRPPWLRVQELSTLDFNASTGSL